MKKKKKLSLAELWQKAWAPPRRSKAHHKALAKLNAATTAKAEQS